MHWPSLKPQLCSAMWGPCVSLNDTPHRVNHGMQREWRLPIRESRQGSDVRGSASHRQLSSGHCCHPPSPFVSFVWCPVFLCCAVNNRWLQCRGATVAVSVKRLTGQQTNRPTDLQSDRPTVRQTKRTTVASDLGSAHGQISMHSTAKCKMRRAAT